MKIGVLALQGAVAEHIKALTNLDIEAIPIRLPQNLGGLDGLVIPGGESTTISKLISDYDLKEPIVNLARQGFPIFGTCAGLVLLAKSIADSDLVSLGLLDIEIKRNAYGRQVNSFETELIVPALGKKTFRGIFIRAPVIQKVEPSVEILSQFGDKAIAVRQGQIIACTFHPELTDDLRFHNYFRDIITGGIFAKGNF